MTRKYILRDDNGLLCYRSAPATASSSSCPDCGMDPQGVPHLFKLHCSPHRFDTRKIYGTDPVKDDTRTELSRPGEAWNNDDGWVKMPYNNDADDIYQSE